MLVRRTILASLFAVSLFAQDPVAAAHQWRTDHRGEILEGFKALLAIPNVAADRAALARNANTLAGLLADRHFATKLLSVVDAPSIVWAERKVPHATRTIVFYAHYDGQPVTPSEWKTPPFTPTLQEMEGEHRLLARSASDDRRLFTLNSSPWTHWIMRTSPRVQTSASYGRAKKKPVLRISNRF